MQVSLRICLCLFVAGLSATSLAATNEDPSISTSTLDQVVSAHIMQVPEFKYIREVSEKLGVHTWLFGGTAAGYAHYVKWDWQREHGDTRFQPDRFDYDYTNIYRSTQDLDIVIDGDEAQAQV